MKQIIIADWITSNILIFLLIVILIDEEFIQSALKDLTSYLDLFHREAQCLLYNHTFAKHS